MNILVVLGTQIHGFSRLIKEVEKLYIEKESEIESLTIQLGHTNYEFMKTSKIKTFSFIEKKEMELAMKKADIVICHGGLGILVEALKENKKIITQARLKKYSEHIDDHQMEIIEYFRKKNYLIELKEKDDIIDIYNKLKDIKLENYTNPKNSLVEAIELEIGNI